MCVLLCFFLSLLIYLDLRLAFLLKHVFRVLFPQPPMNQLSVGRTRVALLIEAGEYPTWVWIYVIDVHKYLFCASSYFSTYECHCILCARLLFLAHLVLFCSHFPASLYQKQYLWFSNIYI